ATAVKALIREGRFEAAASPEWVREAEAAGLVVRTYRLVPGRTVACTAAPDDDLIVLRIELPEARRSRSHRFARGVRRRAHGRASRDRKHGHPGAAHHPRAPLRPFGGADPLTAAHARDPTRHGARDARR